MDRNSFATPDKQGETLIASLLTENEVIRWRCDVTWAALALLHKHGWIARVFQKLFRGKKQKLITTHIWWTHVWWGNDWYFGSFSLHFFPKIYIIVFWCYIVICVLKEENGNKTNTPAFRTQYKCFLRSLRRQLQIKKVDPVVFRTLLKHISLCRVRSLEKSCLHLDHPRARFYPQIFCLSLLWWIPDQKWATVEVKTTRGLHDSNKSSWK